MMFKSCSYCIYSESRVSDEVYDQCTDSYHWEWYTVCKYGVVPSEARRVDISSDGDVKNCEYYTEVVSDDV